MVGARSVATYFLNKSDPEQGEGISNLKLQKLAYYAQGFHLAVYDAPLFSESISAWEHGPVIAELYDAFKEHGGTPLPLPTDIEQRDAVADLTEEQRALLDEVWDVYGQFSAWKLRCMTHEEPPWKDAARSGQITHDALKSYFKTQVV